MTRKKVSFDAICFPLVLLEKKENKTKIYFFSVTTKNISSHVLKISENSLVLRTREFTDIFITFDSIFCIHLKKVNVLYIFVLSVYIPVVLGGGNTEFGYCCSECLVVLQSIGS